MTDRDPASTVYESRARPLPLDSRPVLNDSCPFHACNSRRFGNLRACLAHVKTCHIRGSSLSAQDIATLQQWATQHAYSYCASHRTLNRAIVTGGSNGKPFRLSYKHCKHCHARAALPRFQPPHPSQFPPRAAPAAPTTPNAPATPCVPAAPPLETAIPENPPTPPPASPSHGPPQDSVVLPEIEELCRTRIAILKHIPGRVSGAVARSFGRTLGAASATQPTARQIQAFKLVLLFPAAVLSQPPAVTTRTHRRPSLTRTIRNRLKLRDAGEYGALWDTACETSKVLPGFAANTTDTQRSRNLKRAVMLVHEGALSKAAQTLTADGVAPPTEERVERLRQKHPVRANSPAPTEATIPCGPLPQAPTITDEQVRSAVQMLPRSSAGCGSGLRPNHLTELLSTPNPDSAAIYINGLTAFVNVLATGGAPASIAPRIAGAPLQRYSNRMATSGQ